MKKSLFLLLLFSIVFTTHAQWKENKLENDFDGKFRQFYVSSQNEKSALLIIQVEEKSITTFKEFSKSYPDENVENYIFPQMVIYSGNLDFFCDEEAYAELVFTVNGETKKYSTTLNLYKLQYYVFQTATYEDYFIWEEEFIDDFKKSSKLSIRIYQDYCSNKEYYFNMTNSKRSYEATINLNN